MESFEALLRETMMVVAVLSLPVLVVAAAIGMVLAIVQAATQVQEQTLTLLPKLLAVGLLVALGGGFGMHLCAGLFHDVLAAIPSLVYGL